MKTSIGVSALALICASLALGACGGDDDTTTAGGTAGTAGRGGTGGRGGTAGTGGTTGGAGRDGGAGGSGGSAGIDGSAGSGGASSDAAVDRGADTGREGGGGSAGSDGGRADGATEGGQGGTGVDAGDGGVDGAVDGGLEAGSDGASDAPNDSGIPALGEQIDRVGRPGVSLLLLDPFDNVASKTPDQVKDEYNAASDPAAWRGQFAGILAKNLAVYDALNPLIEPDAGADAGTGIGCGDQLAIAAPTELDAAAGVTRYDELASIIADDRLYVRTAPEDAAVLTCGQFLALELDAKGQRSAECGGRALTHDVVDVLYSELLAGTFSGTSDFVGPDGKTSSSFPFLAAPGTVAPDAGSDAGDQ